MNSKKLAIIGYFILTICLGFVIRTVFFSENSGQTSKIDSTQSLFAASFPDENGKPQALKQWQGKVIVLNFWATWCPPCLEEMPELSALNTQYLDKNVVVLGIATDDLALVKEFSKTTKVSYPLLVAEMVGNDLAFSLGNNQDVLPYTVIIKADGTIAKTFFGRISKPVLEETLNQLI